MDCAMPEILIALPAVLARNVKNRIDKLNDKPLENPKSIAAK